MNHLDYKSQTGSLHKPQIPDKIHSVDKQRVLGLVVWEVNLEAVLNLLVLEDL